MERTNKKFFGIAALAVIAIVVALMFSYFANATEEVAGPVEADVAATESDATLTFNAVDKDPFGNASLVYYVDNATTPSTTATYTQFSDHAKYAFYCDSGSGEEQNATLVIFNTETKLKEFQDAEAATPGSGVADFKIRFDRDKGSYSSTMRDLYLYNASDTTKHLNATYQTIADIKKWTWNASPDTDLASTSAIAALATNNSINVMANNFQDDVRFEVGGLNYGQGALAQFVIETPSGEQTVHRIPGVYHGANISIDESNNKVYIENYRFNSNTLERKLFTTTICLQPIVAGVQIDSIFGYHKKTHKIYDQSFTLDNGSTSVFGAVSSVEYSIDGVRYKVISLDQLKNLFNTIKLPEPLDNYAEVIRYALNSLPSTLAAVSGLEADCPENIEFPNYITLDEYPGKEFQVCAVLTDALNSSKVTSVTFPTAMKVLFADACTGLSDLETVTFKDSGLTFIPDIERLLDFKVEVHDSISHQAQTMTLIEALEAAYNHEIDESAGEIAKVYVRNELSKERALPARLLASLYGAVTERTGLSTVVVNDNYFYDFDIDHPSRSNRFTRMNMCGTFKMCPEISRITQENIMFGTGTFTSVILNEHTGQPVINAKVVFVDEFGRYHETYTNGMGVFTIDDLYQTAAYLLALHEGTISFPFEYRKLLVEADGYETIYYDEANDAPLEPGKRPSPVWRVGCYSYYNPFITSDVVYEKGFKMEPTAVTAYISSAVNTNFVADVAAGSTFSGANVQIYQANQTGAQKFVFEPDLDENGNVISLSIKNAQSGKYLDVCGGVAANYTNVQQYDGNGTAAQKWIPEYSKDYNYVILHSAVNYDYVLDLNGGDASNGQNLQIFQANGSAAQQFRLIECTPAVPAGDFDLADGTYVIRTLVNTSNVLDVQWGSTDDGANVWAYNYTVGDTNQMWEVKQVAWGYYTIKNVHTGKYLDVAGCGIMPGTNVWQYSGNETAAQLWAISKVEINGVTSYKLVNAGTGLALDVAGAGTESGTNVHGYFENGSAAQHFFFNPVN